MKYVSITQEAYDKLKEKDPNAIYDITTPKKKSLFQRLKSRLRNLFK